MKLKSWHMYTLASAALFAVHLSPAHSQPWQQGPQNTNMNLNAEEEEDIPEANELIQTHIHRGTEKEFKELYNSEQYKALDLDHKKRVIEKVSHYADKNKLQKSAKSPTAAAMTSVLAHFAIGHVGSGGTGTGSTTAVTPSTTTTSGGTAVTPSGATSTTGTTGLVPAAGTGSTTAITGGTTTTAAGTGSTTAVTPSTTTTSGGTAVTPSGATSGTTTATGTGSTTGIVLPSSATVVQVQDAKDKTKDGLQSLYTQFGATEKVKELMDDAFLDGKSATFVSGGVGALNKNKGFHESWLFSQPYEAIQSKQGEIAKLNLEEQKQVKQIMDSLKTSAKGGPNIAHGKIEKASQEITAPIEQKLKTQGTLAGIYQSTGASSGVQNVVNDLFLNDQVKVYSKRKGYNEAWLFSEPFEKIKGMKDELQKLSLDEQRQFASVVSELQKKVQDAPVDIARNTIQQENAQVQSMMKDWVKHDDLAKLYAQSPGGKSTQPAADHQAEAEKWLTQQLKTGLMGGEYYDLNKQALEALKKLSPEAQIAASGLVTKAAYDSKGKKVAYDKAASIHQEVAHDVAHEAYPIVKADSHAKIEHSEEAKKPSKDHNINANASVDDVHKVLKGLSEKEGLDKLNKKAISQDKTKDKGSNYIGHYHELYDLSKQISQAKTQKELQIAVERYQTLQKEFDVATQNGQHLHKDTGGVMGKLARSDVHVDDTNTIKGLFKTMNVLAEKQSEHLAAHADARDKSTQIIAQSGQSVQKQMSSMTTALDTLDHHAALTNGGASSKGVEDMKAAYQSFTDHVKTGDHAKQLASLQEMEKHAKAKDLNVHKDAQVTMQQNIQSLKESVQNHMAIIQEHSKEHGAMTAADHEAVAALHAQNNEHTLAAHSYTMAATSHGDAGDHQAAQQAHLKAAENHNKGGNQEGHQQSQQAARQSHEQHIQMHVQPNV